MISWFYGRPSQINKYSKMYTDHGMGKKKAFLIFLSCADLFAFWAFFLSRTTQPACEQNV